jgi:alpha-1,6-mannosyltransferase
MLLLDTTMFWNPTGGVRRYIGAKRRWARSRGHGHVVATPRPDEPGDVRVPSLPLPGTHGAYRYPWPRRLIARRLGDVRPDLIESADPYQLGWASVDAAQRLAIPAVAFCHSDPDTVARLLGGGRGADALRRLVASTPARAVRNFDLVLAPSEAMATKLRELQIARVQHQPLGVDTRAFHPRHHGHGWRDGLQLPADARLLVYAGRFAPEKNLPQLVQVLARLGDPYWLLAIGDGPCPPQGDACWWRRRCTTMPPSPRRWPARTCSSTPGPTRLSGCRFSRRWRAACRSLPAPPVAWSNWSMTASAQRLSNHRPNATFVDAFAEAVAEQFRRDRQRLGQAARARALAYSWDQVFESLWSRYALLCHGLPAPSMSDGQGIDGAVRRSA